MRSNQNKSDSEHDDYLDNDLDQNRFQSMKESKNLRDSNEYQNSNENYQQESKFNNKDVNKQKDFRENSDIVDNNDFSDSLSKQGARAANSNWNTEDAKFFEDAVNAQLSREKENNNKKAKSAESDLVESRGANEKKQIVVDSDTNRISDEDFHADDSNTEEFVANFEEVASKNKIKNKLMQMIQTNQESN
ncbi:hypothetical protein SCLARK_00115 [Spiroplasma clarkii]|uniref:hypothetical protein n=1 Tax=Spiroplasma clarkii TaxID=2139 RepID=UPI000B5564B8|nr:hypothetical protein [Spiroplasma clarkii]ARU90917.1 hypothetical protein SCLARK_00115 [Spiroplasma clarkii]